MDIISQYEQWSYLKLATLPLHTQSCEHEIRLKCKGSWSHAESSLCKHIIFVPPKRSNDEPPHLTTQKRCGDQNKNYSCHSA